MTMDPLIDPKTGRLRVDSQSREYRRIRRRQWLETMRRSGYHRLDVFLKEDASASWNFRSMAKGSATQYAACF